MTGGQIRRLFFQRDDGGLATTQTVNTRLRRLVSHGYLDVVVVDKGRGSGPYAYGLGSLGSSLLGEKLPRRRGAPGSVWHALELAGFRVRLEEALREADGELVEWIGDTTLRSLLAGQRGWPVPDALVHWRLRGREGAFLVEWDRGTESLPLLTAKLSRYASYFRALGHRRLIPGLRLKPRLAVVVRRAREPRIVAFLQEARNLRGITVAVGNVDGLLQDPLAAIWWRSDLGARGSLFA